MKLKFGFGFSKAHVLMILLTIDIEDKRILSDLLKGKSIIRGGGGKYASLTDLSAARIYVDSKGEDAILGKWIFHHKTNGEYFYLFTPFSGKQKIIILDKVNGEEFVYLTFSNYKKL